MDIENLGLPASLEEVPYPQSHGPVTTQVQKPKTVKQRLARSPTNTVFPGNLALPYLDRLWQLPGGTFWCVSQRVAGIQALAQLCPVVPSHQSL